MHIKFLFCLKAFDGLDPTSYYADEENNAKVLKNSIAKVAGLSDSSAVTIFSVSIYSPFQKKLIHLEEVIAVVKFGIIFNVAAADDSGGGSGASAGAEAGAGTILNAIKTSIASGAFTAELKNNAPPGSALA